MNASRDSNSDVGKLVAAVDLVTGPAGSPLFLAVDVYKVEIARTIAKTG